METKDLSEKEFLDILSSYYSKICNQNITIKYNIRITANDNLSLSVFYEKYTSRSAHIIELNDSDINKCFSDYADNLGYALNHYKYIGGINHTGYFTSENTPHFDGIRLYLKEKCKRKIR